MYQKFSARQIFQGSQWLDPQTVLLFNGNNEFVGSVAAEDAGEDVKELDGCLCPGFINVHGHLELSHLKGVIPEHTGLVAFVQSVMTQRQADDATKVEAMQMAADAMWAQGIVAAGDICNTADSIPIKKDSPIQWRNFIEVSGWVDDGAKARMETASAIKAQFDEAFDPVWNSFSPHAPYSVSATLFQQLNEATQRQHITIHNQETLAEDELYRFKTGDFLPFYEHFHISADGFKATGKSSLQSWLPYFNQQQQLILVHNTFSSGEDLDVLQDAIGEQIGSAFLCSCMLANQYIENRLPDLMRWRERQLPICLGTDSLASNHQLSMLAEMSAIQTAFPSITTGEVLNWATLQGARALGMNQQLGSFEPGKQPGLLLLQGMGNDRISQQTTVKRIL